MPYQPPGYDPEGGDFAPVTPGPHGVIVDALALSYGKDSDLPYIGWTFVIAEGEFKNRNLWNNTSMSEKAINMPTGLYRTILAVMPGQPGEDLVEEIQTTEWEDEETMTEFIADKVCGLMATVAIAHRKYEGRIQNNVIGIKPYEGDVPQLDQEEMAATGGGGKGKSTRKRAPAKKSGTKKEGSARKGRTAKGDMDF
jgi:hypothetical protein